MIAGDGCLMEGISHEAIDLAGHLKLNKLIVLLDDNSISIDGVDRPFRPPTDQLKRFEAAGWSVARVDGHDPAEIEAAHRPSAQTSDKPSLIACKTIIGFGAPNKQGSEKTHGAPLGKEEIAARAGAAGLALSAAFDVPEPILSAWRAAGQRGRVARGETGKRGLRASRTRAARDQAIPGRRPALRRRLKSSPRSRPRCAAAKAQDRDPQVVRDGARGHQRRDHDDHRRLGGPDALELHHHQGHDVHQARRLLGPLHPLRHPRACAWRAVMNGIALHGGFVPYGGTFLVFSDYAAARSGSRR